MLIVGYCTWAFGPSAAFATRFTSIWPIAVFLPAWTGRQGVPDHSTFSKNRHGRFGESDMLRRLFESVVQRCITEGLVAADGFAVDASLIAADANKQRSILSKDWKP